MHAGRVNAWQTCVEHVCCLHTCTNKQIIGMRKGWDAQLSRRNSQKKERDADRSEYMQVGSMHGERLANTCVAFIHAQKGLWKGGMRSCQGAAKES